MRLNMSLRLMEFDERELAVFELPKGVDSPVMFVHAPMLASLAMNINQCADIEYRNYTQLRSWDEANDALATFMTTRAMLPEFANVPGIGAGIGDEAEAFINQI